MSTKTIISLQHKAAKVAGLTYLITFAIVVYVNFGINATLIVKNNAIDTARNILANEQLFRIGIAGNLIYCIVLMILFAALYIILKPVNLLLSIIGTLWRLVWVFIWLLMTMNLFDMLRLLGSATYLGAFKTEQLQALGRFQLASGIDKYYIGLLFTALASSVFAYLWLKSRYIPRTIAVFGIISSLFCVTCTFIFFIFPTFDKIVNLWWFDMPMAIFDIVLSFWLLFKGLNIVDMTGLHETVG